MCEKWRWNLNTPPFFSPSIFHQEPQNPLVIITQFPPLVNQYQLHTCHHPHLQYVFSFPSTDWLTLIECLPKHITNCTIATIDMSPNILIQVCDEKRNFAVVCWRYSYAFLWLLKVILTYSVLAQIYSTTHPKTPRLWLPRPSYPIRLA